MAKRKALRWHSLPEFRKHDVGMLPEIGYWEHGPYKVVLHSGGGKFYAITYHTFITSWGDDEDEQTVCHVEVREAETRENIEAFFEGFKAHVLAKLAEEESESDS
jgi:hypothetical protein